MDEKVGARIVVEGKVQGVGFRDFARRYAFLLNLRGFVKNLSNGQVEIEVRGERSKIDLFVEHLHRGPALSKVTHVNVSWGAFSNACTDFSIVF